MITNSYTLTGRNIEDKVAQFVRGFYESAYESKYTGDFLRVYEDYSFWNTKNFMVCIRVNNMAAGNGIIRIEVIAGGDTTNKLFVGPLFGGEKRNIKQFAKKLEGFCGEHMIGYATD